MAEDVVIGIDVNADPAYKKLSELRKGIEDLRKQFMKDVRSPSAGGLDRDTFRKTYGVIKADRVKFLKELAEEDAKYANRQDNKNVSALVVAQTKKNAEETKSLAAAQRAAKASTDGLADSQKNLATNTSASSSGLVRLRYALYDVASGAQATAQIFQAFSDKTITAAIDYEAAFTAVERASQIDINTDQGREQLGALREELLQISQQLPETFQDVSGVAALGSALGIANEDLAAFTETSIRFATATNVGVEAAGQAFGTLGVLLNVNASNYENLGAAIAYVGVNSNATESQVISVAEAIAGVSSSAGLSADYVVGLSGALASLKVPAEQSRGALTRVFAEVNRAAATGGPALNNFANLLGISADEARNLASTDMAGFFDKFVASLAGMSSEDITYVLDDLNLADIRVTNTLVRLAGNLDTTTESIRMASDAYAEGTYLADAYGVKSDDVAVRLQTLGNTVANTLASIGEAILPAIGPAVDALQFLVEVLQNLIATPTGKFLTATVAILSLLAAALLSVVASVIPVAAGILAFRTAIQELQKSSSPAIANLLKLVSTITGIKFESASAAASVNGLTGATNALSKSTSLAALSEKQLSATRAIANAQIGVARAAGQGFNAQLAARVGLLKANTQAAWANVAAMSAMQKVMGAAGWIGIAITAVTLLTSAFQAFAESQKSAFEKSSKAAEDYFGTATGLADAFREDADSGTAGSITVNFDDASLESINGVKTAQQELADEQVAQNSRARSSIDEATGAVKSYTEAQDSATGSVSEFGNTVEVAYGDAAKRALAELLRGQEEFLDILNSDAIEAIGGSDVDLVSALLNDPQEGASKYVESLLSGIEIQLGGQAVNLSTLDISKYFAPGASITAQNTLIRGFAEALGISQEAAKANLLELINLEQAQAAVAGTVQASAVATENNDVITEGYNSTLEETTSAALDAEKALKEYQTNLEAISSGNKSLDDLANSISENGTAFAGALTESANYTQGAINNSVALADTLKNVIAAAAATGLNAAEASAAGVAQVFAQMVANGVEAQAALNSLSAAGYGAFTGPTGPLSTAISGQYAGFTNAFNAIRTSAGKASNAVGGTAAKVRTLIDYANDLKNVWSRAFDIRFSGQSALDKISSSWQDIRDAIQDATEEIADLNAETQKLTADKALQEYFLSVAEAYGDAVSAQRIRANLAEIDNKLIDSTNKLQKAQAKQNKTLSGNSREAIDNRAEILGLVGEYQDYVGALAASGMSQADLAARTAQLKQDFIAQATQLGYNQGELQNYAAAFDDVSTAIGRVPRNITVAANTNPALQALNELNTKANSATAPRTLSVGMSVDYSALARFARGSALLTQIGDKQALRTQYKPGSVPYFVLGREIAQLEQRLQVGNFATGGYVSGPGTSTSDSIAANLSNGEYVIQASAVSKYGVGFFNNLNQMKTPQYYSGGQSAQTSSVTMVALSPEDRALLRGVGGSGEVVLYANNEAIARSANAGNRNIVAQGGRP